MPSRFAEHVLTSQLFEYMTSFYAILKDRPEHRQKILNLISYLTLNYDTKCLKLEPIPQLLIGTIAQQRQIGRAHV